MRPIVLSAKSKATSRPPTWRQCLESHQEKRLKGEVDAKPSVQVTTCATTISTAIPGGTKLVTNMAEKRKSQQKSSLANSLVTVTLKPRKIGSGNAGHLSQVTSERLKADIAGKVMQDNPTPVEEPHMNHSQHGNNRRSIDLSLEKLREEMNSLRKQDVQLLDQLLTLNESIQDFKLTQTQLYDSLSDLSEISDDSDLSDFEKSDQSKFPTNYQSIKAVLPTLEKDLGSSRENRVLEHGNEVPSYVRTSTKEKEQIADTCIQGNRYNVDNLYSEAEKRWHSQVSLKSESAWENAEEKSKTRRQSLASYSSLCKTSNERKTSASSVSLVRNNKTGRGEIKSEAKQKLHQIGHLEALKNHSIKASKRNSSDIERSSSQTSLASDCSGYGTGSSERLSSRSESPALGHRRNSYTPSDSRHKDTSYQFTPVVQKTARSTSVDYYKEYGRKSPEGDTTYHFSQPIHNGARSSSLCCVAAHNPNRQGFEMVYHFVPSAQKTSRSPSFGGESTPVSSRPSFVVSARNGTEDKMFVQPSVTLRCCSGVRYAATRPLRSFNKRQSTIW